MVVTASLLVIIGSYANKVTLVFDGDAAGYKATAKTYKKCKTHGLECDIVAVPFGFDPFDYWNKNKTVDFLNKKYSIYDFKLTPYFREIYRDGITDSMKWEMWRKILPFLGKCSIRMIESIVYTTAIRLRISAEAILKDIDERFPGTYDELAKYQSVLEEDEDDS